MSKRRVAVVGCVLVLGALLVSRFVPFERPPRRSDPSRENPAAESRARPGRADTQPNARPRPDPEPLGTVRGVVLAGHSPIAGAQVRIERLSGGPAISASNRAARQIERRVRRARPRTDSNGAFEIGGVPPGIDYRLVAFHAELGEVVSKAGRLDPGGVWEVTLELPRSAARIRGRALDSSGAPIADSLVQVHHMTPPHITIAAQVRTDDNGVFVTGPIELGDLQVSVWFGAGSRQTVLHHRLKLTERREVDIGTLSPSPGCLTFRLETPRPGFLTVASLSGLVQTDLPFSARGTLLLFGMPEGKFQWGLLDGRERVKIARGHDSYAGGAQTIEIPDSAVREPIPRPKRSRIILRSSGPTDGAFDALFVRDREVRFAGSANSGNEIQTKLEVGDWSVVVVSGERWETYDARVEDGGVLELTVRPPTRATESVHLRVLDAKSGEPIRNAPVDLLGFSDAARGFGWRCGLTDDRGECIVKRLPAFGAGWRLQVQYAGDRLHRHFLPASGTRSVTLRLPR